MRGVFAGAALLCLLFIPAAQARDLAIEAGQADVVQGDVMTSHGRLKTGDMVYVDDTIETGADGHVVIHFLDDAKIAVGINGRIDVDEYVYDSARPSQGMARISIQKAAFEYMDGDLGAQSRPDIQLNFDCGKIDVHGAKILSGIKDGACWVYVIEGKAVITNDGGGVRLWGGNGTHVANSKTAPDGQHRWSDKYILWLRQAVALEP